VLVEDEVFESLDRALAVCWLLLQEENENNSTPTNAAEKVFADIMIVVFNGKKMAGGRSNARGSDTQNYNES
jgi:hypothetical protein